MVNIFNTVVGKPFSDWVDDVIQKRNQELAEKNDLNIHMDHDVALAFAQSTDVSSK